MKGIATGVGGGKTGCVCVYTVYGPVELLFYVMYWYGAYPSIIDAIAEKVLGRASEVGQGMWEGMRVFYERHSVYAMRISAYPPLISDGAGR